MLRRMIRFSIRELSLIIVMACIGVSWWADRRRMNSAIVSLQRDIQVLDKKNTALRLEKEDAEAAAEDALRILNHTVTPRGNND